MKYYRISEAGEKIYQHQIQIHTVYIHSFLIQGYSNLHHFLSLIIQKNRKTRITELNTLCEFIQEIKNWFTQNYQGYAELLP